MILWAVFKQGQRPDVLDGRIEDESFLTVIQLSIYPFHGVDQQRRLTAAQQSCLLVGAASLTWPIIIPTC